MRIGTIAIFCAMVLASPSVLSGRTAEKEASPAAEKPVAEKAAAQADSRAQDRDGASGAMASFVKAFEARDAKLLAGLFSAEGELQNVAGLKLQGREAVQRAFDSLFSRTPEVKAELKSESIRFVSKDTAIDEGTVTVQRSPTEKATRARYTAVVVREDSTWRIASVIESPVEEQASAGDIGWLVGKWKSAEGGAAEIETTYSWDPGKKFIIARFTIKERELSYSGTQVIGVDPATGQIHSWTFGAEGGIAEADWNRDGDHWVLDVSGTTADGSAVMEKNILRRVSDDVVTWQSVNRKIGDAGLADLAPVKVTRVKTEQ
jgi:uncharacterized protein (TIGR02246 family)